MHQSRFETLLARGLWGELEHDREVEICCRLESRPLFGDRLEIGVPASADARCWTFRVRRLPTRDGLPEVEIYHYRSRFKREAYPQTGGGPDRGPRRLAEAPRWPGLGRRSGSILSKMIRRGIGDPHLVGDLLGAMFIVGDRPQAYGLERRLLQVLGGPFRWRDRVDTLAGERDRVHLNPRSSSGFRVLKKTVDILIDDPSAASPYLFAVEVQIFPLEAYLRTLHDAHYASHAAYKRRQFLHELLPLLFPAEVYGEQERLRAALGS